MLWFNFLVVRVGTRLSEFQYILCCGSTFWLFGLVLDCRNFNTSYVVVQRQKSPKGQPADSNFNTSYVVVQPLIYYPTSLFSSNFNTSYVVVQLYSTSFSSINCPYFNTSYVVVQRRNTALFE